MKALMDREEIKKIIPHREPMLLIDEVLEMTEGESIKAGFYLAPELDFFRGHFPGGPVMPGVLTVESMAQASDVLLLSMKEYAGKVPLFIGIDKVSFKKKIEPGDRIIIESAVAKVNAPKAVVTCQARVFNGSELAAEGLVTLAMR